MHRKSPITIALLCSVYTFLVAPYFSAKPAHAASGFPPPDCECQTCGIGPLHFQCYEVERDAFTRFPVSLTDRFGPSTVTIVRPKRLCNPADKSGEDPSAPVVADHLTGYVITQTAPKFARIRGQVVQNQFGTVTVDLVRPDYLNVPSAKSLTSPPGPLAAPAIDHFKCYRVAKGKTRVAGLVVNDQFGTLTEDVKKPFHLCLPADKNGSGILAPDSPLMCYKIRISSGFPPFRGPADPVFVDNQFGADTLHVNHLREICVPSVLNPCRRRLALRLWRSQLRPNP